MVLPLFATDYAGGISLYHTATSRLIWYKMFLRDISYRLIWMEFINMFSVYKIWDAQSF